MEWVFAALMFLLAGNGEPSYPDQGATVSAPAQEDGTVSIMTGNGGFPPKG